MTDESRRWQRGVAGRPLPLGWRQSHNYGGPGGPAFRARRLPVPGRRDRTRGARRSADRWARHLQRRAGQAARAVLALLEREPRLGAADILALQETDEELVARAAEQLGAHYVYYPSMVHPVTGRNFGPAILSRWPIVDDARCHSPAAGGPAAPAASPSARRSTSGARPSASTMFTSARCGRCSRAAGCPGRRRGRRCIQEPGPCLHRRRPEPHGRGKGVRPGGVPLADPRRRTDSSCLVIRPCLPARA